MSYPFFKNVIHDQGKCRRGLKKLGDSFCGQGGINFVVGDKRWRLNFICTTGNVSLSLSLEQETATAKYVGVNKLSREILIKIAPFLDSQVMKKETSKKTKLTILTQQRACSLSTLFTYINIFIKQLLWAQPKKYATERK